MLSLITINYNNDSGLKKTIQSVIEQNINHHFEHIIIDGASTDKSNFIIEEYKHVGGNVISKSEPDYGIYDAMNKGLHMASGSHVAFLNSGDVLVHNMVLDKISSAIVHENTLDFLYGDICIVDSLGKVIREWRAGNYMQCKLFLGWMPPHPMTTIRKHILDDCGNFDENLRIAADYDLMLKVLLRRQTNVRYLSETLVHMEAGGISNGSLRGMISSNLEVLKSWFKNKGIIFPFWIVFTKPLSKLLQIKR